VSAVLIDLEVIKPDYSPTTYAKEFDIFYKLCIDTGWNVAIYTADYTAEWFLPYLAYWPNADYWWAQWPYQFYPDSSQNWDWSRIHTEMENRGSIYPSNQSRIPGRLKFWQFTGDRLIFPGNSRVMDVNVAYGSLAELEAWAGGGSVEPPADIHEKWFNDKVDYFEGWREVRGRRFYAHVSRFKRSDVKRIHVNGLGFQGTGEYFFNTRGKPDIVINGGHADYSVSPPVPFAVVVTDGEIQKTKSTEFSIQFNDKHQIIGIEWFANSQAYNTVGVSSTLLENGNIPMSVRLESAYQRIRSIIPFVDDTYVDPRNALFWNDAEFILITIDGRNNGTQGATQLELAEFAKSIGALNGGNLDGGNSNTLIYNKDGSSVKKNNPPDNIFHAVANFVGIWLEGSQGEIMNGLAKEKLGKTITTRTQPASRPDNSAGTILPNAEFEFVAYADDLDHPGDPNYKWVELTDGSFANYIYPPNGLRLDILREPSTDPIPPTAEPITVKVNAVVEFDLDGAHYGPQTGTIEIDVPPNG